MDSMQGVVGIRPYLPPSKSLEDFERKWKRNLTSIKTKTKSTTSFNLFGLCAYDTVWALAMAVEKAGIVHSSFLKKNDSDSNVDLAALGIFEMGTRVHNTVLTTKFQGLSGNFHLVKAQLEPPAFELFNIIGKTEIIIGCWTRQRGFPKNLNDNGEVAYSTSKERLKPLIWPGYTTDQPTKLRIGVPVKKSFEEFLKVEWDSPTDKPIISGFSIDVFLTVQHALPFPLPHEFIPYMNKDRQSNGTYDELLYQIKTQVIPVGVVLDLKSPVGRVAESYMSMARSDFYAVNHNYRTRLTLFARDSGDDVITAASTVLAKEVIPIGVVLDLKSPVGRVAESYMSMARSDFYAVNHNYRTRLTLFAKDSGDDVITAASTAHVNKYFSIKKGHVKQSTVTAPNFNSQPNFQTSNSQH
nr:glutamate receptor 2.1 [Quercus suber]